MFKGIFTALLTPFGKGNKISEKALEALVKHNLSMGVKGFYVCGSTGEAVTFLKKVTKKLFGKKFYRLTRYSLPQRSFANCLGTLERIHNNSSRGFSRR